MKLLVFGSTGGTGRELVKQARAQGHEVTAYACNRAKLNDMAPRGLEAVRGDVLDSAAVEQAVLGHDAVLCAVGAGAGPTTLREDGTRNIVRAMDKAGVRRLICQSSMGVGDSRANLGFLTKYVIVAVFLRHAFRGPRAPGGGREGKRLGLDHRPSSPIEGRSEHGSLSARLSHHGHGNPGQDVTGRRCRLHVEATDGRHLPSSDTRRVVLAEMRSLDTTLANDRQQMAVQRLRSRDRLERLAGVC
jgi:hypothetical protein